MHSIGPNRFLMDSTGRVVEGTAGLFSVDEELTGIYTGFTGQAIPKADLKGGILAKEEKIEIAQMMIERWQMFCTKVAQELPPPEVEAPQDSGSF